MNLAATPDNEIPAGDYCYTVTGPAVIDANGMPRRPVRICPYWKATYDASNNVDTLYCGKVDPIGETRHEFDALLHDQCKICGINNAEPDEDPAEA